MCVSSTAVILLRVRWEISFLSERERIHICEEMTGVQQRLKLKQTPIDTWSVKEHLTLASAVLRTGDQASLAGIEGVFASISVVKERTCTFSFPTFQPLYGTCRYSVGTVG